MRTRRFPLLLLALFGLLFASCEIASKVIDSRKKTRGEITRKAFEKDGLAFSYPDNWKVTEDEMITKDVRYVNVEDPDNTVFIVSIYPSDFDITLDDYVEKFKQKMPSNLTIGRLSKVRISNINRTINGQSQIGRRQNFSLSLSGQEVPHTTDFFQVKGQKRKAFLTIQAPDEDWDAAEPEIQVILDTLKLD